MKKPTESHICETCGGAADTIVEKTKQWFCLECALGLPKGSLPRLTPEN